MDMQFKHVERRKTVTGRWRGTYEYDTTASMPKQTSVPFTLNLRQGWFGTFKGDVTEAGPNTTPGTGTVRGWMSFPRIEFTKEMPVGYTLKPDGSLISIRESIIAQGRPCDEDVAGSEITYRGKFTAPDRAEGVWVIDAAVLPLPGDLWLPVPLTTGTWKMEFEGA